MRIKSVLTKPVVLLLFSAILSALPLTFSNLFPLSWVSFVPLFYVLITNGGDKLRRAFGRGFWFGFLYHVCIYYWFLWFFPLDYVNLNENASLAVVALAWFGISAVHGVLWCLPFVLCHLAKKITRNPLFISALAIAGIIATQKITLLGELSFPWTRVSLGQYKAPALIQMASVFGIDGVDMIILAVNALIAVSIVSKNRKRIVAICMAAVIFCANLGFGLVKINQTIPDNPVTITTIQSSVPQGKKWSSNGDKICFDVCSSLTKENVNDDVDLVLWPESAVPTIYENEDDLKQYKKLSKKINVPIVAGIILETDDGYTNNAVLIDKNEPIEIYTKRQMVPFGEYMPYKNLLSLLFPELTKLNIIEDDYVAGKSSAIMKIKDGKIGSVICFESIYPKLVRQSTLDGAELMIELTNDAWLEDSPAMYQHLAHGVFRSVENGRYLIRSANSGISAVIDNLGFINSHLAINEQGVITDTVHFSDKQTIYTKIGDILFPISIILIVIWFVVLLFKRKKTVN